MSSPIIPAINIAGTSQVPGETAAPETSPPAGSSLPSPTISEGLKSQQGSVDQAASNAPSLAVPAGADQPDASLPSLAPADLMALQLQSFAQRQSGADAAVAAGPPVKDIATNQSQLLPLVTPYDLMPDQPAATDTSDPAIGDAGVSPVSVADDALAALQASFQLAFSHLLNPTMVMDLGFFLAGNWLFNNISSGFTGTRPGGRMFEDDSDALNPSNRNDDNVETVITQRWIETIRTGGKLKEAMIEEIKEKVKDVTVSDRRFVHVFEPSEVAQSLRKHDLMPADMPHLDAVCQKLAKAAQQALDELSQALPTRRFL